MASAAGGDNGAALAGWRSMLRIYGLGARMFPRRLSWADWKNRGLMLWRMRKYLPAVHAWYATRDNPWLAEAQARFPLLAGSMYLPYINFDWTPPQRLAVIDRHYRLLDWRTAILARSIGEAVELADFAAEYPGLRLVLDKAEWLNHEGEAALNLFVDEHRCYSVVFTLAEEAGERVLLVGALQGSGAPRARELYRDLTHALHGMRPRDLLLASLKLLARQFGIERLLAISGGKRWQVAADYDAIWLEHRGVLRADGFFVLPAEVPRRDFRDLPPNKRKSYRRRYEMLDRLGADIIAACTLASARLAGALPRQEEAPRARACDVPVGGLTESP